MDERIYVIHALSPLHPGTGRGQDLIDLPIAREVTTTHPFYAGSSLKGVLRERVRAAERLATGTEPASGSDTWRIFGPDTHNAALHAGAISFSDARLVLLPVRSDHGTFAWITSPLVLARLARDAQPMGLLPKGQVPSPGDAPQSCMVAEGSSLVEDGEVQLDVATLSVADDKLDSNWADAVAELAFDDRWWQDALRARMCLVHDDIFTWLAQTHTEVRARIRMDPDKGTVAKGALWYEEALPSESVLVGVLRAASTLRRPDSEDAESDEARTDLAVINGGHALSTLAQHLDAPIQLGGHATVGLGLSRIHLRGGAR